MKKVNLIIPILWLVSMIYLAVVYSHIPSQVGIHYGYQGMPDRYGAKSFLWSLPLIFLLVWVLITTLLHYLPRLERNMKGKNESQTTSHATEMLTTLIIVEVGALIIFVTNVYYLSQGKSYLPPYLLTGMLSVLLIYFIWLFVKRLMRARN